MRKIYFCILSLLFLTLFSLFLYFTYTAWNKPKTGLEILINLSKSNRFTETRLSGVSCYGLLKRPPAEADENHRPNTDPFLLSADTSRGENNSSKKTLTEAFLLIKKELKENPSPNKTHNLAIVSILFGHYTEAINNLENTNILPKSAKTLNDLAAAYSERGDTQKRPADFSHALSLIDEALSLDNSLIEAKFNQALLLEKVSLLSQARNKWKEYLLIEKDLGWQKEAWVHINDLNSKINLKANVEKDLVLAINTKNIEKINDLTSTSPHLVRVYIFEKLLPELATLIQQEKKEKVSNLIEIGTMVGDKLFDLQQDKSVANAFENITKLSNNPKQLTFLASAYLIYFDAITKLTNYENNKAKELFEKALLLFLQTNDESGVAWTKFQIARCEMVLSKYKEAIARLKTVSQFAEKKTNWYLLARSWWITGLIQSYQSEFSSSLASKNLALIYLQKIKAEEDLCFINCLIAATLLDLKNSEDVWFYQNNALQISTQITDSNKLFLIFSEIAHQILNLGERRAAAYFYQELNLLADSQENQTYKFSSLLETSQLYQKLNNKTLANLYLTNAQKQLEKISDQGFKTSSQQLLLLTQAQQKVEQEPENAITLLDRLEEILPKDAQLYKTSILRVRAKAYLTLKQYDKAEEALKLNIETFENQRSKITNERHRLSFFEDPQAIYEDMILFQINQRNRLDIAFNYAELARSRTLLDAINGRIKATNFDTKTGLELDGTSKPLTLNELQVLLPPKTILIRYFVMFDHLYIWLITKNKFEFVQQEILETGLERQISNFRSTIIATQSPFATFQTTSETIYQNLFSKIEPYLKEHKDTTSLVIVPDKALYGLPFSALINPKTKQYLVENYSLLTDPSATIYSSCLTKDKQLAKQDKENILSIGDPTFTKKHFPSMPYLPGAKNEAQTLATLYPSSKLLLGKQATKETFLKEATKYDIIHYAGHAMITPNSPLFSKLLFAFPERASENYDEALYAYEIYTQKFTHTRLIVLAACKTAGGMRTHGEGMINLARPFLASGIPTVIASLWDANDKASVELFKQFHIQRLTGQDSATALRNAQLQLIKNSNKQFSHPRMWALFQIIGGCVPEQK